MTARHLALALLTLCLPPSPALAQAPAEDGAPASASELQSLQEANALRQARLEAEMAEQVEALQRLETEQALREARRHEELGDLRRDSERLQLEAAAAESTAKLRLNDLEATRHRLELEAAVRDLEHSRALAEVTAEIADLHAQMELAAARHTSAMQEQQQRQEALALQNAIQAEEHRAAVAALTAENERLQQELARARAETERRVQEIAAQTATLAAENDRAEEALRRRDVEYRASRAEWEQALAEVETRLQLRDSRETWRDAVDRDIAYPAVPFADGILTISDRRIPLNEPIIEGTADFVARRIHYFNNQSTEAPIFIVIDRCPGGSVMEGYRILKAMEASEAPIHVVVKSFAASMAATIATMAEHSYAYPNAILLHHQPFGVSFGNLTQQDEQMRIFREWARRLHAPVAAKMGLSLDDFYARMYERNSDGDWQEFAEEACRLRWVDHVVNEIREEGYVRKPTDEPPMPSWMRFWSQDGQPPPRDGQALPRLRPFDCYFLYNPDGFYRWAQ